MNSRTTWRLVAGGTLAACVLGVGLRVASADQRLAVVASNSGACYTSDDTNTAVISGEAWGYNMAGQKVCEIAAGGTTAMSQCMAGTNLPAMPVSHEAHITLRTPAGVYIRDIVPKSALVNMWTQPSTQ